MKKIIMLSYVLITVQSKITENRLMKEEHKIFTSNHLSNTINYREVSRIGECYGYTTKV